MHRESNTTLQYKYEDMISVLYEVEKILMSLHRMSSYYYKDGEVNITKDERIEYEREIVHYIEKCHIEQRLSKIRETLTSAFDLTLSDDDMDDIERAVQNIKIWRKPGDCDIG